MIIQSSNAAFWVGAAGSAFGLGLILASPVWGRLADRTGRKQMVLRATGLGGVFLGMVALTRTPLELVAVRFLFGTVAGNQAATTSLVAAETPAADMGQALGLMGASTALGRSLGPLLAGALATTITLRLQFTVAGLVMLLAVLPLAVFVRETDRRQEPARRLPLRSLVGALSGKQRRSIVSLIIAQSFVSMVSFTALQFLGLRIIEVAGSRSQPVTGLAFALAGIGTAIGALFYARFVGRFGYQRVATTAAALVGLALLAMAVSSNAQAIVAGAAAFGVFTGACIPAVTTMIGLETPEAIRATVYGAGLSLVGVLFVIVPAIAGVLASRLGASAALGLVAASSLFAGLNAESAHPRAHARTSRRCTHLRESAQTC